MKVFVINLDKDKARMSFVDAQLRAQGINYERVSGVNAKEMPKAELLKCVNLLRWWCAVGRPIVPAEIGVALSHASIYKKMKSDEAVCVFEDDVFIDKEFKNRLAQVSAVIDVHKPQVYLFSDHQRHFTTLSGMIRSNDGICADGYVITQRAAAFVLKDNFPMKVPCDHWFRWAKAGHIELYHILPTCVRQNQAQFGTSTQANADDVSKYPPLKWIMHKSKRAIGKSIDKILLGLGL